MAHERLRFPLVLNRPNNSTNSKEYVFKPLYSDMQYATHYAIYGDFVGKRVDENDKNAGYEVNEIDFRIQNYTGEISVGITKIIDYAEKKLDPAFAIKDFSTGRLIKIYVMLQGMCNRFSDSLPPKPKDEQKPANPLKLILHEGDVIEVVVFYEPVDNAISKIFEAPEVRNEKCLYADPLYLYRDGEEIGLKKNALDRVELIDALKTKGLQAAVDLAKRKNMDSLLNESTAFGDEDDIIFGGIGGGRPCKMKLSDVYIL